MRNCGIKEWFAKLGVLLVATFALLAIRCDAQEIPPASELADFLPVGTVVNLIPNSTDKFDVRIRDGLSPTDPQFGSSISSKDKIEWAIKQASANRDPNQKARMARIINELEVEQIASVRYKVVVKGRDFVGFEAIDKSKVAWMVLPVQSIHSIRR